jgi:hypothetical protein
MVPCVFSIMVVLKKLQIEFLNMDLIEAIVGCMVKYLTIQLFIIINIDFRMCLWSRSLFLSER